MIQTVIIPHWRPAPLNKLMKSRWTASRLKKSDRQIIAHYCEGKIKASTKRMVSIDIIMGKGMRKCDPDAFYKSSLDALKHAGMIIDDSDKHLKLGEVTQERQTTAFWGTIITLTDIVPCPPRHCAPPQYTVMPRRDK